MERVCRRVLAALAVLAVGLSGVAFAQVEATTIEIQLGEFFFQVEHQERNAPIVLEAGRTYVLEFKNVGSVTHEVLIGRGLVTVEGRPEGYEVNLLEGVALLLEGEGWEAAVSGLIEFELEPQQELEVVLTLPESLRGTWEIGCFVPGHYEAGMHAPFMVE